MEKSMKVREACPRSRGHARNGDHWRLQKLMVGAANFLKAMETFKSEASTRCLVENARLVAVYFRRTGTMTTSSELEKDIALAREILIAEGCREIYLFGSVAKGSFSSTSDIDIATVGLAKDRFFRAYGTLLSKLHRHVDLVGLDFDTDFGRQLKETGVLTRVA